MPSSSVSINFFCSISCFSGYMAPEYVMRGNYSVKSDAFSFGVMVLEIVNYSSNSIF